MYVELYLVTTGFLILDGDNLDNLFPGVSVSLGPVALAGKQLFVVLVTLVIVPTTLGVLAYVSVTGVFASVIIVLRAAVVDGVGFSGRGTTTPLLITGLPTALGFWMCNDRTQRLPDVVHLYEAKVSVSEDASDMLPALNAQLRSNGGALGYLIYGDGVLSQLTLNLIVARLSPKVAIYTMLLNPLSKICGAVGVSVVVRTLLVLSTVAVAPIVSFFAYLMALVGSLLIVGVSMLLIVSTARWPPRHTHVSTARRRLHLSAAAPTLSARRGTQRGRRENGAVKREKEQQGRERKRDKGERRPTMGPTIFILCE
uniref:Amino acid transporter transmembrane domain-containing protein n=1 Tax=Oryza punctata TaxID=4537 RepID=A0A0E0M207_ORYPU